jgi:nicotinamidase-related amidase
MTSTRTLQQILEFYRMRGYVARLGSGERCAVIVIDFSCAFTRGAAGFPGGDFADALAATRLLLDRARGRVPVIFTTIAYEPDMRDAGLWAVKVPWLRACQLDDVAAEIDPVLARQPSEPVIVKKYPSAFFGTDLHARLQQACIDTVLIAGCTTSVCIRATALDAMQHGYRPLVVREAVGEFDAAIHELHLADLDARYADVIGLDQAVNCIGATAGDAVRRDDLGARSGTGRRSIEGDGRAGRAGYDDAGGDPRDGVRA